MYLSSKYSIISSYIDRVNISEGNTKCITFIAPFLDVDPPFYDVGFIDDQRQSFRKRLSQLELRNLILNGYTASSQISNHVKSFLDEEKRLNSKESRRLLTGM